jgi:hypothetical protein
MRAELWLIVLLDVVVFAVILGMAAAIVYRLVQHWKTQKQPPTET